VRLLILCLHLLVLGASCRRIGAIVDAPVQETIRSKPPQGRDQMVTLPSQVVMLALIAAVFCSLGNPDPLRAFHAAAAFDCRRPAGDHAHVTGRSIAKW
jgi:hypothetical protein